MSTPFRVDLADIEFLVFDHLKIPEVLGATERYRDLDRETYRATFEEAARIATQVLDPINQSGDREGCRLDEHGDVASPSGFKAAWQQLVQGGWIAPDAPVEFGGVGLPHSIGRVVREMHVGANTALMMYAGLTAAAARMIETFGDASYRPLVASKLFTGEWSGTMCLTESGAGSSVGDTRAKAIPTSEPLVHLLEGEKIFISGGDTDIVENVVHLVLARTPGSPSGTKGLSLFMVPKFEFDSAGNLGRRNGAQVVSLEHKMGIHGNSTCTLALGTNEPCRGWLVGAEHAGIAQMFKMMNEARLSVGGQGSSAANAAYNFALQYANEREQGGPLQPRPEDPERVAIVQHPDVRRMLMTLKVIAETTRAALTRVELEADIAETTRDDEERQRLRDRADLLIPVLKAHCTDLGFEMAVVAVQVYGGYGYIREFPVEQLVRDTKIQSIYEGTNGIQALDLLGRKMRVRDGSLFRAWVKEAHAIINAADRAGLESQGEALSKAVAHLGAAAAHLGTIAAQGRLQAAFLYAVPFLKAFGGIVLGLEALDQARVAQGLIAERGRDRVLVGKLLNLDFYLAHLLPQATGLCRSVQSGDESCLDPSLFTV